MDINEMRRRFKEQKELRRNTSSSDVHQVVEKKTDLKESASARNTSKIADCESVRSETEVSFFSNNALLFVIGNDAFILYNQTLYKSPNVTSSDYEYKLYKKPIVDPLTYFKENKSHYVFLVTLDNDILEAWKMLKAEDLEIFTAFYGLETGLLGYLRNDLEQDKKVTYCNGKETCCCECGGGVIEIIGACDEWESEKVINTPNYERDICLGLIKRYRMANKLLDDTDVILNVNRFPVDIFFLENNIPVKIENVYTVWQTIPCVRTINFSSPGQKIALLAYNKTFELKNINMNNGYVKIDIDSRYRIRLNITAKDNSRTINFDILDYI